MRICPRDSANACSSALRMEELKNCWAWLENVPVAMPVTALKSESTVLALKLKKSVRKARDAVRTAGSC